MKKQFSVFSMHRQPAVVEVTLSDGVTKVPATIDSLEVQLVPLDASGTLKLSFTDPTEITEAEAKFAVGSSVVISVELGA